MLISIFLHKYPQEGATGSSFLGLGLDFQQIHRTSPPKLRIRFVFERHGVLRFPEGLTSRLASEKPNLSAEMIPPGARVPMSRHRVLHSESWQNTLISPSVLPESADIHHEARDKIESRYCEFRGAMLGQCFNPIRAGVPSNFSTIVSIGHLIFCHFFCARPGVTN